MPRISAKNLLITIIPMLIINTSTVLAYLDPGSGSMLLQILIGGLATAGIILKTKWNKVKLILKRKYSSSSEDIEKESE